jgi:sugar phosphate isomerase/epimerase
MANRFGRLALHMWTIDTTPLATALDAARAAGYDAVELRRIDFKRCFEAGMSNAQVLDLVRNSGIAVGVLGVEYGWLFAKGEDSKRIFGVFRESCENAVALRCGMLMSAPGPFVGTVAEAIANLKVAGDIAAEFGLRLAIEFNSQHPVLNNMAVQREIVGGASKKNVGLLLDAYHLQRGGRPGRGFAEVPGAEIFYVQFSDVPDALPPSLPPVDRLPPGKGVVDWTGLFGLLAEKGYDGWLSYEAPNPAHWARPAAQTAAEGAAAARGAIAGMNPG